MILADYPRSVVKGESKKLFAVFAVFLIIVSLLSAGLSVVSSNAAEGSGTSNPVTYHYGFGEDAKSVSVTYSGARVAEYNPEFWSGGFIGKTTDGREIQEGNWIGEATTIKVDSINLHVSWSGHVRPFVQSTVTLPWTVTADVDSDIVSCESGSNTLYIDNYLELPGSTDITLTLSNMEVNARYVFGGWVTKDLTQHFDPGCHIPDDVNDLYALWVEPDVFVHNIQVDGYQHLVYTDYDDYVKTETVYGDDNYTKVPDLDSNKYTTIYKVSGNFNSSTMSEGTYRSDGNGLIDVSGDIKLTGPVIIDNIRIRGDGGWNSKYNKYTTTQTSTGLFACGLRLIIGTNVTCDGSEIQGYVQIYGGSNDGSSTVNADGTISADVRIFSGTYSNIIGGSSNDVMEHFTTTNVVIVGNTKVLESVIGGSIGSTENDGTVLVDVTNVLVAGGNVDAHQGTDEYMPGDMSTVIGGSRFGTVGSTNVEISGDASVFAVQGGGRQATSKADSTHVVISGEAKILYMVCGSVTDGNGSANSEPPVDDAWIEVRDSPHIKSIYGGGWDIWELPNGPSTEKTRIDISGTPDITNVYGGGFRGTVGTDDGADTVSIVISGGTIGNVYGGGRGGQDPVYDVNSYVYGGGIYEYGGGREDSTGPAKIRGNASITITGGTIGYVYGGGQGAKGTHDDCASISGNVTISISSSAKVTKDIYGGGKGVPNKTGVSAVDGSTSIVVDCDVSGSVYGGGEYGHVGKDSNVTIESNADVSGSVYGGGKGSKDNASFAEVKGTAYVTVSGKVGSGSSSGAVFGGGSFASVGATHVVVNGTEFIASVYGGGSGVGGTDKSAVVNGDTYVEIDSSIITGDIYGAGLGSSSNATIANVGGSATVVITGDSTITGDVYGGGMFGSVADDTTVTMSAGSTIDGDVYGGGNGSAGDTDIASVGGTATVMIGGTVTGHVYGGGNLATVRGTTVTLASATVNRSVYGGGSGKGGIEGSAVVYGSTNVEVRNSQVDGSVYGGGYGETVSINQDAQNQDAQSIATIDGSTSVTISGSSTIDGDVFGGGMYGGVGDDINSQVQSLLESIQVTITGSVTVGGSVYGGGYGETGRVATYVGQRIITINGPSIQGSVYGGSRFGDDNSYIGDDGKRVSLLDGESRIYLVSGDVLHGSSGNIYGAGYRGYSNFDTHIYIGTEAMEATDLLPMRDELSVRSVYGGSSIGDTVTDSEDGIKLGSVLMSGDSHIYIGGTKEVYKTLSLSGNVYGSGDYCEIDGDSYITFDNFRQDGTMQSVQKATEVVITSSSLELVGDMDGATTEGSARFSFNRVGMLRLEQTDAGGTSDVVMHAATSRISGYVSSYETEPSADATTQDVRDHYNSVTMLRGMIFSILGSDNTCNDMGEVSGITYFENDEDYYGAFAIAGKAAQNIGQTDFKVVTSKGTGSEQVLVLESADYHDTEYNFGDRTAEVRTWFIKGAYMVEGTAIIQDKGQGTSGSTISVDIPKIRTTSSVAVVGYYTNSSMPGSLNVVSELQSNITPGNDLVVVLGASGSGSIIFGEGSGANLASNDTWPMKASAGSSGISLGISITTASGFTTTGYIGSITIHMAEMSGDTVTDVFDVVIGVYLRMVTIDPMTITKEIILDGENSGTTKVYLPALSDNRTGVYTVTSFPKGTQYFGINTVPSNISKDGWVDGRWSSKAMVPGGGDNVLGTAAVYSPVISIDLTMADYEDGDTLTMEIDVVDEATDVKEITITVVLKLRDDPMLTVTVFDTSLNLNDSGYIDTKAWLTHTPVFRLEVGYNSVLSDLFVLVRSENVSGDGTVHWKQTRRRSSTRRSRVPCTPMTRRASLSLTPTTTPPQARTSRRGTMPSPSWK